MTYDKDSSGQGRPWWLSAKGSTYQCRRLRFHPCVRKIPGEGNGSPLQYSCLENPMGRGAWWATVHGVPKESDLVTKQLQFRWNYKK